MGGQISKMTLPPADKVEDAPYELRKNRYSNAPLDGAADAGAAWPGAALSAQHCTCRAPRLTGLALRLFVPFIESPFSSPLYAKLLRDSGIPQVRGRRHPLRNAAQPPQSCRGHGGQAACARDR